MHNASCDFRKFDGSDVDRLNKELAVFRGLTKGQKLGFVERTMRTRANLVKISFLGSLKLFLEEQHNFFHISARCHAQDDAYSFASDLYVSAEGKRG